MKKRWEVFWLVELGMLLIYIMLCFAVERIIISAGVIAILLSVYWSVYYNSLKYTLSNKILKITSGIIFRKHRSIPLSNILWEMRLTSPFFSDSAMTVLHTSGGNAVVFCNFSTTAR